MLLLFGQLPLQFGESSLVQQPLPHRLPPGQLASLQDIRFETMGTYFILQLYLGPYRALIGPL